MKGLVAAFPFCALGFASLAPGRTAEPVQRQNQRFFPACIEALDGFDNGRAVDPAPRLDQFTKFLATYRGDPESLLLFEGNKAFGQKPVQCFAHRAAAGIEPVAQRLRSKLFTGAKTS